MAAVTNLEIRPYRPSDEDQWLRCRVLSFLYTSYFDNAETAKPRFDRPSAELVAVYQGTLVGLVDAQLEEGTAMIDTIAVHPDHQGRGVGRRLLEALLDRLRADGFDTVEAWTRDDEATVAWYRAMGFTDQDHHLHVYAVGTEAGKAVSPRMGRGVRRVFFHADISDEERMRAEFGRVHVCRRFVRPVNL
ncbi:GNAT family N-acetyltransferase [Nocardiopsis valliformis]|uniref:GNAT family N-acetyltransferase n=1 Tax=Nocardiopsis valliformis TaxID=239974 RepID=UPI00037A4921|nr:GNAT family N-acetyltransferase [Nocardiopsis valliformis]